MKQTRPKPGNDKMEPRNYGHPDTPPTDVPSSRATLSFIPAPISSAWYGIIFIIKWHDYASIKARSDHWMGH